MKRALANKIARIVTSYDNMDTPFVVENDRDTLNRYRNSGRDVLKALRIHDVSNEKQYRLLFSDWRADGKYYMNILDDQKELYLAEFFEEVNESEISWKYRPRKRDYRNDERKRRFEKLYGSCDVNISLPVGGISVTEFLTDLFHLIEIRQISHDLNSDITGKQSEAFPEGRRVKKLHLLRERSSRVVREAKKLHADEHNGSMPCEVCGFDYRNRYGPRGDSFIEAHHRVPLSLLAGNDQAETQVNDLALVCANCHRMLHKQPWLTVEELREVLNTGRTTRKSILCSNI